MNGNNLLFTNWFDGEPNNMFNEDCVEFDYNSPNTGTFGWNDLTCSITERGGRILRPICKQEQTRIVSTFLHMYIHT